MDVCSFEDSAGEFCCAGSILSMKLLGFTSKAIKLLLTGLVGQCMDILPLAFSSLISLRYIWLQILVLIITDLPSLKVFCFFFHKF